MLPVSADSPGPRAGPARATGSPAASQITTRSHGSGSLGWHRLNGHLLDAGGRWNNWSNVEHILQFVALRLPRLTSLSSESAPVAGGPVRCQPECPFLFKLVSQMHDHSRLQFN